MKFKQYPVSQGLQEHIAYFWTLESSTEEAGITYRFIPDGNVDWIFHLSDPWTYRFPFSGNQEMRVQSHLFGQIKNYLDLTLPEGKLFLFGVNFHPWAAKNIWNINLNEVTDNSLALKDVPIPDLCFLEEEILESDGIAKQIQAVETFVRNRLSSSNKQSLAPIVQNISKNPLTFSLSDYSIKKRRIEQRFKSEIGISAKHFQRTIRVNKIIQRLIQFPEISLTQLAYEFNFYDQSHFILDFKKFTGCTPSKFLKSISPSGPIYNYKIFD